MVNTQKNNFRIYNKSSEKMQEVTDASIDLVVADPPWNVGLEYSTKVDNAPHSEYSQMMGNVISEIARVLKPEGIALMILPKIVRKGNQIYNYPEVFLDLFHRAGVSNNYNFDFSVHEDDFTCLPAKEIAQNGVDCHSEEICGLVFTKNKQERRTFPTLRHYEYASREGHPCPYPSELVKDILDTFYTEGNKVLDPFMGTGSLGDEVLKRKGQFLGYELESSYYQTARKKLEEKCKK
jgi:modification methylase